MESQASEEQHERVNEILRTNPGIMDAYYLHRVNVSSLAASSVSPGHDSPMIFRLLWLGKYCFKNHRFP